VSSGLVVSVHDVQGSNPSQGRNLDQDFCSSCTP